MRDAAFVSVSRLCDQVAGVWEQRTAVVILVRIEGLASMTGGLEVLGAPRWRFPVNQSVARPSGSVIKFHLGTLLSFPSPGPVLDLVLGLVCLYGISVSVLMYHAANFDPVCARWSFVLF